MRQDEKERGRRKEVNMEKRGRESRWEKGRGRDGEREGAREGERKRKGRREGRS